MRPRFHDGLDVIRQMHMIEFSLASKRRPEIVLHCITILSNNNKKDNFEFNLKLIAWLQILEVAPQSSSKSFVA